MRRIPVKVLSVRLTCDNASFFANKKNRRACMQCTILIHAPGHTLVFLVWMKWDEARWQALCTLAGLC